jgi:hypothetical protein
MLEEPLRSMASHGAQEVNTASRATSEEISTFTTAASSWKRVMVATTMSKVGDEFVLKEGQDMKFLVVEEH